MPAARRVLMAAVLDLRRPIGMAGARRVFEAGIVLPAGIAVADDHAQRRAAQLAIGQTGQHLKQVGLGALGAEQRLPGRAAAHEGAQLLHIRREARGQAIHHHAHRGRVGLPEYTDAHIGAKG